MKSMHHVEGYTDGTAQFVIMHIVLNIPPRKDYY